MVVMVGELLFTVSLPTLSRCAGRWSRVREGGRTRRSASQRAAWVNFEAPARREVRKVDVGEHEEEGVVVWEFHSPYILPP